MLDVNPILVVFSGVTFLIMLLILNSILYKPMIAFMSDRDSNLNTNQDSIIACENSIKHNQEQYEEIMHNAYVESEHIIDLARKEASQKADVKIQDAITSLDKEYVVFQSDLNNAKNDLEKSIIANESELSQAISSKLKNL